MSHDSEIAEHYRELKSFIRAKKANGIDCPGCKKKEPKRIPTRLIPGKKCKVCGTTYANAIKAKP